jgi:Pyridoxamine 5'-phosphate oxidase
VFAEGHRARRGGECDGQYDPRTGMIVLEPDECWRLLREADVGRLAVSIGDRPDIFPINHVVDGETVVFKTLDGTKLSGAVFERSVAFEAGGYDAWTGDAWSVVVKVAPPRSTRPRGSSGPRPCRCSRGGRSRRRAGYRSTRMRSRAAGSTWWLSRSRPPDSGGFRPRSDGAGRRCEPGPVRQTRRPCLLACSPAPTTSWS